MDYGALPPEINSTRMYTGPGSGPLVAAAAAWDALSFELRSAAAAYGTVIESMISGPWVGPSSAAMASAAAPYVAWMSATASQAEMAGSVVKQTAGAFESAFAATVPPPVVALNRAQVLMLAATNFLGQNTPAIAALETEYVEMWAQDAMAMYSYAANAVSAVTGVTPFTSAPQTTSASGLAAQAASQLGSASGGVQSALSQVVTAVPSALQELASPGTSALAQAGLSSGTTGASAESTSIGGLFGSIPGSTLSDSVIAQYATYPGLFGLFMGVNALGPLMNPGLWAQLSQISAAQAAAEGAAAAAAAQGAAGAGFGGLGGFAGMGAIPGLAQAASVGGLTVPSSWGYAAKGPAAMLGTMPLAAPIGSVDPNLAAGLGMPMVMGGGSRGAAAGGNTKYGLPLPAVMTRPPAAGYGPGAGGPPAAAYPVPEGFPLSGQAPPGYQPAIVYVPTGGPAPTN